MAAVAQDFSSAPATAKASVPHPLCPLTATEISTTADLLRSVWPSNIDLRFKVITLDEPAKKQMIPYLEAEHSGAPFPQIPRKSFVSYYIRNTVSSPSTRLCQVLFLDFVPGLTSDRTASTRQSSISQPAKSRAMSAWAPTCTATVTTMKSCRSRRTPSRTRVSKRP